MIVDDDAGLLRFMSAYLARLGYAVSAHRSGEQAWKKFDTPQAKYGLVLIDFSLAGLSGEQLSRMILKADPEVRIILTSGYPLDPQKLLDLQPNRVAFLHKPFTPAMLVETVDRMLRDCPVNNAD